MWILAAIYFLNSNTQYIVLLVFGFLAIALGYADLRSYKNNSATGKERISKHLTNMMGGTIAVVTCFSCQSSFSTRMGMVGTSNLSNNSSNFLVEF